MKLINTSLAGRTVKTSFGTFKLEKDGTVEVSDEIAKSLLQRSGWATHGPVSPAKEEDTPELDLEAVGAVEEKPKKERKPRFKRNK